MKSLIQLTTYRKVLEQKSRERRELWKDAVIYKLEPIFHGGKLITTYKEGYLKAYIMEEDGSKQVLFDDQNELKK